MTSNQFYAVIETGGSLKVGWSGYKTMRTIISGELIERAQKVLDFAGKAGNVCVSAKTYQYIMQHDYSFYEKEISEEICGQKFIYAVGSANQGENAFVPSKINDSISEDNTNVFTSDSLNFIEKLKEDEISQPPNDNE